MSFFFGTPTTSTGLGAGIPAPHQGFGTPPSTSGIYTLPTFGTAPAATVTVAPPAFGFGATPTAPATPTMLPDILGQGVGAFALNKPQPTTTAQPFNTGLPLDSGSAPATQLCGIFGNALVSGIPQATAPSIFVGLGGSDANCTQDELKIKESQVPDELVNSVDALKSYIKDQKTVSSNISRAAASKLNKVSHDIINLKSELQNMSNSIDTNEQQYKLLRSETAENVKFLEMVHVTPGGLQFEYNASLQYLKCLVARYEQQWISFRQHKRLTEQHMHALASAQNISCEDVRRGCLQLHESFKSLAGRLEKLHKRVEEQKQHYLNLRRLRLGDDTNVFEEIDKPPNKVVEPQCIGIGPTPFVNISGIMEQ